MPGKPPSLLPPSSDSAVPDHSTTTRLSETAECWQQLLLFLDEYTAYHRSEATAQARTIAPPAVSEQ